MASWGVVDGLESRFSRLAPVFATKLEIVLERVEGYTTHRRRSTVIRCLVIQDFYKPKGVYPRKTHAQTYLDQDKSNRMHVLG